MSRATLLLALIGCSDINITTVPPYPPEGTCPLDVPAPGDLDVDLTCGAIPTVTDPWSMTEEWSWFGAADGTENSSYSPPLVARLADTNDDGTVDDLDHPIIVLVAFPADLSETREGHVVALDGVTHEALWETGGIYYAAGHAIGDVTGDGSPDIVAFDAGRRVLLLDATGEIVWRSVASTDSLYPQATIADLDADGVPEVIADNLVLAGPTGTKLAELVTRSSIPYTMPAVGDIDLDGHQEILYGNTLHGFDGTPRWTTNFAGDYGHFGAILDVDDDPEGEIAMVGGSRLVFFDTDGTELHRHTLPRRAGSAPCVADFDGDGASEIAFALTNGNSSDPALFRVYEIDGEVLWEREVADASGISGCSGYDFDGDGASEILYADEQDLYVFDGASGAVRYQTDHASGTVYEYPVVADVDLDGAAELLAVRSNDPSFPLLTVIGHAGAGWAPSGTTWPLHDFAVTNESPDGGIPTAPPLYWVEHNTYRARPIVDTSPVNLRAAIVDVCVEACSDTALVNVGVQAWNEGSALVPSGVPVTLWAVDGEGARALATQTMPAATPGRVVNLTFALTWGDVDGADLVVRVDDIGTGAGFYAECHEDDNTDRWSPSCE